MRALKIRSIVTNLWKLTMTSLQLHEKLPKNSTLTILWSLGIWRKMEKWNSSVSASWADQKKKIIKVSSFLILYNNNKPFLDLTVTRDEKWILYENWQWPVHWLDQEAPKYFPKPVKFSSVSQSCRTLCDPMYCSMPGLPVHHQLLESTQTHVHWAVMPSNHLILCRALFLPPSIFPSLRIFSKESALRIRWPEY